MLKSKFLKVFLEGIELNSSSNLIDKFYPLLGIELTLILNLPQNLTFNI